MNKEIEYVTESEENEEMAEAAGIFFDALNEIQTIVDTYQPSSEAFQKIYDVLKKAGV